MKTLNISILVCILISLGGAVFAQTTSYSSVKLNVPVNLTDLNEAVEKVRIYCWANKPDAGGTVAYGVVEIPRPADGRINQTVVVVVKQDPDRHITDASKVVATLDLYVNGHWQRPSQRSDTPYEYRAKSGTEFNEASEKPIPWPQ